MARAAEHTTDVIVIGAGPAGVAAATTAARGGARVEVFDRARFPRPKTCGDAVSNRGGHLVDQLVGRREALTTVPHAKVRISAAILPDGEPIERDYADDPGWIVPRLHLDDLLRRALEDSGARLHQGENVRTVVVENDEVKGVQIGDVTWRAPVVIAADGPGSVGWAALGRRYQRGPRLGVAITAYYDDVEFGGREGVSEHYFARDLPCGYGWIFPAVDGTSNVGVYQRADRFDADDRKLPALLDAFMAHHPERFEGATLVGRPRVWALPLATLPPRPGGPGILLAGDAAHGIDPLSGEGIWQALHSGRAAGRTALRAVDAGGLRAHHRAAYYADFFRHIAGPALTKLAIQEALARALARGLDRDPRFVRALHRGYNTPWLEAGKLLH